MTRKRPHDRENKTSLSREKRKLVDFYLPLDSVDGMFNNYGEYLRADLTLCLDYIQDLKDLLNNPNHYRGKKLSSEYCERFDRLDELKRKSEKENGKYPITQFFEENSITSSQATVLRLLLATNGIGVQTDNPFLTGEELMVSLNLLHDITVEDSRKLIMRSSELRKKRYIGFKNRTISELERSKIGISEIAISKILGGEEERIKKISEETESNDSLFSQLREKESEDNSLLVKEEPQYSLDDVVLPSHLKESILSVLEQYEENDKFYEGWGMKEIAGNKGGANLLLSGPSGCGKTMVAKAIGDYLDKEVRYVAFDKLLSSYYGQSERNIGRLFEEINERDCVVIIDEADGLLNRRFSSEGGAADSSENRIVDIFLRELSEGHESIVVLTSNFSKNIDKAVNRRLDLSLKLPFPDEKARKKIWQTHIPEKLPIDDEVDFDRLAEKFEITGGQIKNAVINAARKAISVGKEKVCQKHFEYGAKLEMDSAMEYSLHDESRSDEKRMGYA